MEEINPEGVVREDSLLQEGDIIFVRSNGNRQLIGRSLFIRDIREKVTHSAFTIRARFHADFALPRFYAYVFRSPLIRHAFSAYGGGTNISNLNQDILANLMVPLPSLPVQGRIVSILSAYDDLIENNTRRIKILEEMARALYREWFVEFRAPGVKLRKATPEEQKVTGKDVFPVGWILRNFTDIIDVLSGGTPKTSVPEYWGSDISWFTPRDIGPSFYVLDTERKITELGLSKCNSRLYPAETVFITARGTVGKCVLAAVPMAMSQTSYALVGREDLPQHLVYLLTLNMVDALKQSATGAVFDTIVVDTFRAQSVTVPPKDLQAHFAEIVVPMFAEIKNLLAKNVNLRRTRDLLLPRLVSGELDVEKVEVRMAMEESGEMSL